MANPPDNKKYDDSCEFAYLKGEDRKLYLLNQIHMERDREFRAEQKRWKELENQHISIKPTFNDYVQAYELEVPLTMLFGASVTVTIAGLISLL